MVAAPLTSLLQGGKQRLNWTQASEQSFDSYRNDSPLLLFYITLIQISNSQLK